MTRTKNPLDDCTSLPEVINHLGAAQPNANADEITDEVMDYLNLTPRQFELLRMPVRWLVGNTIRRVVRSREDSFSQLSSRAPNIPKIAAARFKRNPDAVPVTEAELAPWRELLAGQTQTLSSCFDLPDGRQVTWGEATVEDHLLRATMQRNQANSVIEDAKRHESVAAMLVAAGKTCLNDLAAS